MRGLALLFCIAAAAFPPAGADALAAEGDQKPYTIEDGKVDKKTFNGWRRYTESCLRCHGPDGAGSSYGPDLVDSVRDIWCGGRLSLPWGLGW